uniref:Uncharacterized protein n=1 Tax=Panagrolaimus sp. ES5 TaxID=591445 RepID=A0AC34FWA3_9BILA
MDNSRILNNIEEPLVFTEFRIYFTKMEDAQPNPVKIEPKEELEDILADAEPSSTSAEVVADIKPVIVKVQENEEELEEIDIMGTSDNEEAAQMSSSNGSVGRNENRNKQVSFVHPSVASSSSSSRMHPPTRVAIPIKTRITKKTAKTKTKYVRDANKRDMTFNTQDYNYMEDELFFKKEEIPLPFEDVRLYEHGLEQRPLGEQRYEQRPLGEQRYVVDAIANAFAILQQEARKIQGQLRALNARSGRIRKQIDREEEAIARGEDPTEVPRSSKGLLEGEMMIPVKPAPTSWCNNRRKKKVIRRRPQATNNGAGFGHDEENSDYE